MGLLYLNEYDWISFEYDRNWNQIDYINDNLSKNTQKIKKCVNYHQRKICVIQKFKKSQHNKHNEYDQYRIIITKKMKENNENDEYAQMMESYTDDDEY